MLSKVVLYEADLTDFTMAENCGIALTRKNPLQIVFWLSVFQMYCDMSHTLQVITVDDSLK